MLATQKQFMVFRCPFNKKKNQFKIIQKLQFKRNPVNKTFYLLYYEEFNTKLVIM